MTAEQLERRRLADRQRQSDPERRAAKRRHRKAYKLRNPERVKTWSVLNHAIETGEITRGVCEVCGSSKVEAHHEDYSKPLDVHWLCPEHHRRLTYRKLLLGLKVGSSPD